jgi:hypothetical protein
MLGIDVSCDRISMNIEKLAGIAQWPVLSNVKAVRSFLGLANISKPAPVSTELCRVT